VYLQSLQQRAQQNIEKGREDGPDYRADHPGGYYCREESDVGLVPGEQVPSDNCAYNCLGGRDRKEGLCHKENHYCGGQGHRKSTSHGINSSKMTECIGGSASLKGSPDNYENAGYYGGSPEPDHLGADGSAEYIGCVIGPQ